MFEKHLYPVNKKKYLKNKRQNKIDKCILCAIRDNDENIKKLEIYRDETFIITINLYPYNPGHIMIFPQRHIEDLRDLNDKEKMKFQELTDRSLSLLEDEYNPHGFNIGINLGRASGASIKHLHKHIVPRYHDELGFVDILSGSKIYIEKPQETYERLMNRFKKL